MLLGSSHATVKVELRAPEYLEVLCALQVLAQHLTGPITQYWRTATYKSTMGSFW